MNTYEKMQGNPAEEKAAEKARADVAKQQALIEYLYLLTGIDMPDEDGEEVKDNE